VRTIRRSRTLRDVARLLWATVSLLLALLTVVPAPTYVLWQMIVLVTELGIVLAAAALLAVLPGWRRSRAGQIAAVLAVIACVLALSPLVRVIAAARNARTQLTREFPGDVAAAPFRLVGLLTGTADAPVPPATHVYARRGHTPLLLDLYRPPARTGTPRPAVVAVHGGSWRGGDRRQLPELNWHLARRGYVVAAIDYRLAPAHTFPAPLDDVHAAVLWLVAQARALDIDTTRIALLGRSAGAHLALLAAYELRNPAIRGVVSLYGPTDLRWGWLHPANPRVIDSRGVLRDFLGGTLAERGPVFDRASPLRFTANAVPTLLIHGQRDDLVRSAHADFLAAALRARGIPHAYVKLPWATHGCDYVFRGPCGQLSTWAIDHFLNAVFNRKSLAIERER
jgi:acetyl esterase/lipase